MKQPQVAERATGLFAHGDNFCVLNSSYLSSSLHDCVIDRKMIGSEAVFIIDPALKCCYAAA